MSDDIVITLTTGDVYFLMITGAVILFCLARLLDDGRQS